MKYIENFETRVISFGVTTEPYFVYNNKFKSLQLHGSWDYKGQLGVNKKKNGIPVKL